jgi:hypothetical protein
MATAEKVFRAGIKRETGWLYYLDKNCNIARVRMVRGGQRKKKGEKAEIVVKTDISGREDGYLYFIDKQGDVSRTKMSRGGTARKKKRRKKASKKTAKKGKKKAKGAKKGKKKKK